MKRIIVLFILIFILTAPAQAIEEKLDFNPDYDRLSFDVEGSLTASFLFINPTLEFKGYGRRNASNSDWLTPAVLIEEAYFNILFISFGKDTATDLAGDLIGSVLGVTDSEMEALNDYYLTENDEAIFFVYKDLIDYNPQGFRIIELVDEDKIIEKTAERNFSDGRMYAGKITFNQGLITNLIAYSNDWWADLDISWKEVSKDYRFPDYVTGEGYHDRPITIEVDFYNYKVE